MTSIPLCQRHHAEIHYSRAKFEQKYNIDCTTVRIACMEMFIEDVLKGNGELSGP